MKHIILTETEFFRLIDNPGSRIGLSAAYNEFTMEVVSLCTGASSPCHPLLALSYAETELQYHKALQDADSDHGVYVLKALAFVRKMLEFLTLPQSQVPPLSFIPSKDEKKGGNTADTPPMRWTGSISDLTELLYGLDTLKCVNNGEVGMNELVAYFSRMLGMELKDTQCYNAYVDIRRRKNGSRTYFFDRISEKLNLRIAQDDERERARKR